MFAVVKVGGSLFDLPDLGTRLVRWLGAQPSGEVLLVPGGGATADVVRELDRCHRLGEERAHWLALRALALNASFLSALLPRATVVEGPAECPTLWERGQLAILDAHAFAAADEGRPGALPHSWEVTSDAIAARVAVVAGARSLVLLKSVTIPEGLGWDEAGQAGYVDSLVGRVAARVPGFQLRCVNLRDWSG